MESLKKTEKIFSNSIDISTKAEYIVTIKSYLHPNERFGKERKMKKVLSVLAILAVAAGFVFADAADKSFKLTTSVEGKTAFTVAAANADVSTFAKVIALAPNYDDAPVTTTKANIKTVAAATNKPAGNDVKVTASATPLTCAATSTPMGYTLFVGSDETVVAKDATKNNIAILSITSNGTQAFASKVLAAQVNADDFAAAAEGDYVATITFTVAGV